MFLFNGYYYLDNEHNNPLTKEIFEKLKKKNGIIEILSNKYILSSGSSIIEIVSLLTLSETVVYQNPQAIKFPDREENPIDVYSLDQLKQLLVRYDIELPLYNGIFMSPEKLRIHFHEITEIKNFDFKVFNETIDLNEKIRKQQKFTFRDLSKYIKLYLKTNLMKNKDEYYCEILFTQMPEFDPNSEFNYYEDDNRENFNPKYKFKHFNQKEIFLTGPHGIGKTVTLLYLYIYEKSKKIRKEEEVKETISKEKNKDLLNSCQIYLNGLINKKDIYSVYFNLEILSTNNDPFQIIIYETRYLFDSIEEYQKFYKELKDMITNIDFLKFILIILEKFINMKKDKTVYIILDQFKYKNNDDLKQIDDIRNLIKKSSNLFLIICSSLNYGGVKTSLIKSLKKDFDGHTPIFHYFKKLTNNGNKFDNNAFLAKLGYLPIYCEMNNYLSKKILNLLKKKIKAKVKKFYQNNIRNLANQIE